MEQLTPIQNQALCLLSAGYSPQEIATKTGVSLRTIARWKTLPNFNNLLRQSTAIVYDAAVSELVSGAREAAQELKRIIADPEIPSRTKVSAISVLLTNASKAKEALLEERLERVEDCLNGDDVEQD